MNSGLSELDSLLQLKTLPKELFQEMIALKHLKRDDEEFYFKIIKKFLTEAKIDLCNYAVLAIEQDENAFDISRVMEDLLPFADVNIKSLIKLLRFFQDGMKNDMSTYKQYISIENLADQQPATVKTLLENLMSIDEEVFSNYISCIIIKLSASEFNFYHNFALVNLGNVDEIYVRCGLINALSRMKYSLPEKESQLALTLKAFDELESSLDSKIIYSVVGAYGNLLSTEIDVTSNILNYSNSPVDELRYTVSHTLFIKSDDFLYEKWFEKCVHNFHNESFMHKGTLDHIDYIMADYVKKDNSGFAIDFLIDWVLNSDCDFSENSNLCEIFNSTFSELTNDKTSLEKLLTYILMHDDNRVHRCLLQIASYIGHNKTKIGLCPILIKNLSISELLYILRKSLANFYTIEMLSTIALSILAVRVNDENVVRLINEFFTNNIAYEYYHSSVEILDQKILSSDDEMKNVLISIKRSVTEKYQNIFVLPPLKELRNSNQKYVQLEKARATTFQKAMDSANNKSVFLSMVTTTPLKYGNKFTSYFKGSYQPPSKLSQLSHSIEIPLSEILHPVHSAFDKFHFRRVKKGDR